MPPLGQALLTGPSCKPFRDHLATERARTPVPTSWAQVETAFLEAMAAFDREVCEGNATEGERQNGKGDYFNDLLALILEANSKRLLTTRRKVSGLIFPNHNLDVTYPQSGVAEVLVEAKMMGTPKHPGSPKQKAPGRPGQADLLKRAKELGFKAIDLKAGFGLQISQAGGSQHGPVGDLSSWSRSSMPRTYFLMAVRVVDAADLNACIVTASNINKLLDGVGLFAYTNDHITEPPLWYGSAKFGSLQVPSYLELAPMLFQISSILSSLPPSEPDSSAEELPMSVPPPPGTV